MEQRGFWRVPRQRVKHKSRSNDDRQVDQWLVELYLTHERDPQNGDATDDEMNPFPFHVVRSKRFPVGVKVVTYAEAAGYLA